MNVIQEENVVTTRLLASNNVEGGDEQIGEEPNHASRVLPTTPRKARHISFFQGVFALLSTSLGGGMLSLPFAMSKTGIIGGILALLFCSLLTCFSNEFLINSVDLLNIPNEASYTNLALITMNRKGKIIATFCLFNVLLLASISYVLLMSRMLVELVNHEEQFDDFLGKISICILSIPLYSLKDLSRLKKANFLTVLSSIVLIIAVIYQAIRARHEPDKRIKLLPSSLDDVLYSAPFFLLSFVAQFTVLPVYSELVEGEAMARVSRASILLGCVMYSVISIGGYLLSGKDTCDSILSNMPNDFVASVTRLCLIVTLATSFPLLVNPLRAILNADLLGGKVNVLVIDSGIWLVVSIAACLLPSVALVFSLVGSSFNVFVSLSLPSIMHVMAIKKQQDRIAMLPLALFVFSIGCSLLFFYSFLKHSTDKKCDAQQ